MLSLRQVRNTSSPKVRFNIESTVNTEFDGKDEFIEDFMPTEASNTKEKDERARRFSYYRTISERAKLGYSVHQFGKDLVLEDDVSLLRPSTYLKYQGKDVHIFDLGTDSIVLERDESTDVIHAKYTHDGTFGLYLTRAHYAFFALLMIFILASCGIQVLLFVFLGIASRTGLHHIGEDLDSTGVVLVLASSVCSLPILIFGLANTMAIAWEFVKENWNGHQFLKAVIPLELGYIIDWVSAIVYVYVPLGTCAVCLFVESSSRWWFYTLASCQVGAFFYFLAFYMVFIYKDMDLSLRLVKSEKDRDLSNTEPMQSSHFGWNTAYTLWLWAMKMRYSGKEIVQYTSLDDYEVPQKEKYIDAKDGEFAFGSISFGSRLTLLLAKLTPLYDVVQDPKRLFHVEEVYHNYVLRNKSTWALDRFFWRDQRAPVTMAFINGDQAFTNEQRLSSTICFFTMIVSKILVVVAILVWFRFGTMVVIVLALLFILTLLRDIINVFKILHRVNKIEKQELYKKEIGSSRNLNQSDEEKDKSLFFVTGQFQITEASEGFCIFMFMVRLALFFFFPVISIFVSGNVPVGLLFGGLSIVTFSMGYLSSPIALGELGSTDGLSGMYSNRREEWRSNHILKKTYGISCGSARRVWTKVFLIFSIAFGALTVSAFFLQAGNGRDFGLRYTSDFEYKGKGALQYSSCEMTNGAVDTSSTTLLDYSFLSTLAYETKDITNATLDTWFQDTNVINHEFLVEEFREEYEKQNSKSSVSYKFIGFPDKSVGVVSVRGTLNLWDVMSDIQLWAGALISQLARSFIPVGNILTPLFEFLVEIVAKLESSSLEKVSFYKQTTAFVNHVKELNLYDEIYITGHSLGGGIAMISGVQTETFAIAISGPNAKLSRNTFSPPLSEVDIDEYAFNVLPAGDIVPMIDDPSKRIEKIECRLNDSGFLLCHMPLQTFCELNYVCGSKGRPVPCACAKEFGYAEPTRVVNANSEASFEQVCENPFLK
jgi:lipase ATG15